MTSNTDADELAQAAREFLAAESKYRLDQFVTGAAGPANWPLFAKYELTKARLAKLAGWPRVEDGS